VNVHFDKDGLIVKELIERKATVTYVTPSHQFPIGMVMPITRRMELLNWAAETGVILLKTIMMGSLGTRENRFQLCKG
jgi:GntR family transcriptional regulator/MocR family aminotransferase